MLLTGEPPGVGHSHRPHLHLRDGGDVTAVCGGRNTERHERHERVRSLLHLPADVHDADHHLPRGSQSDGHVRPLRAHLPRGPAAEARRCRPPPRRRPERSQTHLDDGINLGRAFSERSALLDCGGPSLRGR